MALAFATASQGVPTARLTISGLRTWSQFVSVPRLIKPYRAETTTHTQRQDDVNLFHTAQHSAVCAGSIQRSEKADLRGACRYVNMTAFKCMDLY